MPLSPQDIQSLCNAAEKAENLIEAFKYIIHTPDAHHLTREECAHAASLIDPIRKKAFWDTWHGMEPDTDKEKFFTSYIRTTSQHYKSKNYSGEFKVLTNWLARMPRQSESPAASFAEDLDMKRVFEALANIKTQLIIDGGKNSFRLFQHTEEDRRAVRKKAFKAEQTADEYIDKRNIVVNSSAFFLGKPVEEYIEFKNHEVNRRKDVLQVLVIEIAGHILQMKDILYPKMAAAEVFNNQPSAGLSL